MKRNIFLVLMGLVMLSSFAQKVDLDRQYIKVKYTNLPTEPILDENFRTYFVNSNLKNVADKIKVYGFEKLGTEATINVDINIENIIIEGIEIKKREKVNKDKEGKVISTQKFYTPHITYTTRGRYSIHNSQGEPLSYGLGSKNTYKGNEYNSNSKASNYYKNNSVNLNDKFQREFISSSIYQINKTLNNHYGYERYVTNELFWILDSKKNEDYSGHNKALEDMKALLVKITPDEPLSDLVKELQPIIDYFESVIPKYPEDKSKHRKMKYASYYNIGKLYYHFDLPEKAIEYATKLIENDYDKGDGKRLIKDSEALLKQFEVNNLNTRHFPVETVDNSNQSQNVQPAISKVIPIIQKPLDINYIVLSGNKPQDEMLTKKLLKTLETYLLAKDNTGGETYLLNYDYIINPANNNIIGQRFWELRETKKFFNLNLKFSKDTIVGADLDGSNKILSWEDGSLVKIRDERDKSGTGFKLKYDSEGRLIGAEAIELLHNGAKIVKEIYYENNQISKVIGYSNRSFKKWIHKVKTFTYEDDITYVNTIVYKKGRKNTPENEVSNLKGYYKLVDNNNIHIKHLWGDTVKYEYNSDNQILNKNRENSYGKWDYAYTYVDGKFFKEETIEYKNDIFKSKQIILGFDQLGADTSSPQYTWKQGKYKFNDKKELVFESRDGKYREKKNGFWSEWKYIAY